MTLRRIAPGQVELGMFVHAFEGGWLNHPFWRTQFLVDDEDRLSAIRKGRLAAVVIDTARGRDLAPDPADTRPPPSLATQGTTARRRLAELVSTASASSHATEQPIARPPAVRIAGRAPRSGPVPIAREFGNARLAAGRARKAISKVFLEARLGKSPRVADVAPLVEDIFASIQRNPYAFSGLMLCKSDSEAAYQHMLSVSALMVSLARQMRLPPGETRLAGMAGLLLDVGLAKVDTDLAAIARDETGCEAMDRARAELRGRHCVVGREMLAAADDVPDEVLQVAMRHHERLDGSGFPQGLDARDLDVFSRMASICDRYDLLVSGAGEDTALDPAEAMQWLMERASAFDADILARFKEALGVYPVGAFVVLRSQRIAMVIDQSPDAPELPTVKAFYSLASGKHVRAQVIALSQCFGEDAIEGVADLCHYGLPPAQDLRAGLLK
ncbi:DUF3391 domain-containing protein [Novosphingobium sp. YJ-S2-02]|uniref:DUF3391 domain-containing protein n=1 Tax=Novosphingobium aureum TaxID=2792964 RepID=A0A931HDC5_9SPHN|nr:HD-GYP domain-containing protein [Novosphingobium aureum]MBH0113990.1 DUF3391 domain-containing protein [Novosphingobium aureum]